MDHKSANAFIKKLDKYQKVYYESLMSTPLTCCNARAGSGKTTIAVLAGLQLLDVGAVNKLIYLRFPDKKTQGLGALPGELEEKEAYYMGPFMEALTEFGIMQEEFDRLKGQEQIQVCTNTTWRGANVKDSFLIIDEAQNGDFDDLKMVLTRIHEESCKVALIGHSAQCDNPKSRKLDAFSAYIHHMCQKPFAKETPLKINHRGKLSDWADRLMLDPYKGDFYVDNSRD